jgi:hypothetical protein
VLAEHPERVSHVLEEGFHTTSCDCSGQYHAGAVRERARTVPPTQTDAVRRGGAAMSTWRHAATYLAGQTWHTLWPNGDAAENRRRWDR